MRSVPRIISRKGEHLSACGVCGVPFLRSSLVRGRDNVLRCPEDAPGRDEQTLAELTAQRAAAIAARVSAITPADGAFPDTDENGLPITSSYTGPVSRRTAEDVYNNDVPTYDDPGTLVGYPGF